ncbi:hypothetical protein BCR44DRAFT_1437552, partial [Catenaria anguillulae PL171]
MRLRKLPKRPRLGQRWARHTGETARLAKRWRMPLTVEALLGDDSRVRCFFRLRWWDSLLPPSTMMEPRRACEWPCQCDLPLCLVFGAEAAVNTDDGAAALDKEAWAWTAGCES